MSGLEWQATYEWREPDADDSLHAIMQVAWADAPEGRYVRFRSEDDTGGYTATWTLATAHAIAQAILACSVAPDRA